MDPQHNNLPPFPIPNFSIIDPYAFYMIPSEVTMVLFYHIYFNSTNHTWNFCYWMIFFTLTHSIPVVILISSQIYQHKGCQTWVGGEPYLMKGLHPPSHWSWTWSRSNRMLRKIWKLRKSHRSMTFNTLKELKSFVRHFFFNFKIKIWSQKAYFSIFA